MSYSVLTSITHYDIMGYIFKKIIKTDLFENISENN